MMRAGEARRAGERLCDWCQIEASLWDIIYKVLWRLENWLRCRQPSGRWWRSQELFSHDVNNLHLRMVSPIFSWRVEKATVSEIEYFFVRHNPPKSGRSGISWEIGTVLNPFPFVSCSPCLTFQSWLKYLGEFGGKTRCPDCQKVPVLFPSGQNVGGLKKNCVNFSLLLPLMSFDKVFFEGIFATTPPGWGCRDPPGNGGAGDQTGTGSSQLTSFYYRVHISVTRRGFSH